MIKIKNIIENTRAFQNSNCGEYRGRYMLIFDSWDDIEEIKTATKIDDIDDALQAGGFDLWGFSDEYTTCYNCGTVVEINSYTGMEYIVTESELLCLQCVGYNTIINEYMDDFTRAIPFEAFYNNKEDFKSWHKVKDYMITWGDSETPENIINNISKRLKFWGDYHFIFVLTNSQPFGSEFSLYLTRAGL